MKNLQQFILHCNKEGFAMYCFYTCFVFSDNTCPWPSTEDNRNSMIVSDKDYVLAGDILKEECNTGYENTNGLVTVILTCGVDNMIQGDRAICSGIKIFNRLIITGKLTVDFH